MTRWMMAALLALLPVAAHAGTIEVSKPWVRATVGATGNTAAYFVIANTGAEADWLIGVATPGAAHADVHNSTMDGGMMKMEPVPRLEIPAGGQVALEPRGLHVMIMQVKAALKPGDTLPLTLTFEHAGAIDLAIPVLPLGSSGPD